MKPFLYIGLHAIICIIWSQTGQTARLEKRIKYQMLEVPKQEVCYKGLGCFKQEYPFVSTGRPVYNPPASPEEIGTQFLLYTRENRNKVQILDANNETTIISSNFRGTRCTKFVIHGFTSNGYSDWVVAMTQELLTNSDVNVIDVNWKNGAEFPYIQATSNIRVVAAQIVQLFGVLITTKQLRPEDVHLIGHSLGAHMAGYVGQKVENIARITGLDPASILFFEDIPKIRLYRTDATFVDVIHTNCGELGFGLNANLGHADYYVNNAEFQPGCEDDTEEIYGNCLKTKKEEITTTQPIEPLTCSHHRSIDYFTESINEPCLYWAFECPSLDSLQAGDCWYCTLGETCDRMGYHAVEVKHATNRTFLLTTGDTAPFCRSSYLVYFKTGFNQLRPTIGKVSINAVAKDTNGEQRENTTLTFAFQTLDIYRHTKIKQHFQSRLQVYDFMSSEVTFQKNAPVYVSLLYSDSLYISKIGIESINKLGTIERKEFCTDTALHTVHSPTATFQQEMCSTLDSAQQEINEISKLLHLTNTDS